MGCRSCRKAMTFLSKKLCSQCERYFCSACSSKSSDGLRVRQRAIALCLSREPRVVLTEQYDKLPAAVRALQKIKSGGRQRAAQPIPAAIAVAEARSQNELVVREEITPLRCPMLLPRSFCRSRCCRVNCLPSKVFCIQPTPFDNYRWAQTGQHVSLTTHLVVERVASDTPPRRCSARARS
jgi:hypothetical protein